MNTSATAYRDLRLFVTSLGRAGIEQRLTFSRRRRPVDTTRQGGEFTVGEFIE